MLFKAYLGSDPSKPVVRGSLVKNGLKIVNKSIVMNVLLVSVSPMFPNKSD